MWVAGGGCGWQWRSQSLKHSRAQPGHLCCSYLHFSKLLLPRTSEQNNTLPIQFVDSFCRTIQRASNCKSSLHRIYKDEYSNDFAYTVIRLIKITKHNEKALTVCDTAWNFLHGPKQIFLGPDPGLPGVATPLVGGIYGCG